VSFTTVQISSRPELGPDLLGLMVFDHVFFFQLLLRSGYTRSVVI